MTKDDMTELAKMLKERENETPPSITTGIVIDPPPNPRIRLNDVVVLDKEQLIFASHMVSGYERNIKFTDVNCGTTTTVNDGASPHNHSIEVINIDTLAQWTDTIIAGDEVILVPVMDQQLYYVLDKAVRF